MNDQRFYYPQPQDLRSDLTYKHEERKEVQMFEIENGTIKCKMPLKTEKLIVNDISSDNGIVIVNGTLQVDKIETKSYIEKQEVVYSARTIYVDTEIIRAEDNIINLNYKGSHQTSKMGGIRLIKGIDDTRDAYMVIDDTGYWNIYPGINVPVLNVETINFEEEENGMLIGYLNGNKIGIKYKLM